MGYVALRPADKLLTLLGIYETYHLDEETRRVIERRVLAKYGYPVDSAPKYTNAEVGRPYTESFK